MNSFIIVLITVVIFAVGAGLYFYFSEKKHQH
jgi:flagellar basal body-associated protein FliL